MHSTLCTGLPLPVGSLVRFLSRGVDEAAAWMFEIQSVRLLFARFFLTSTACN